MNPNPIKKFSWKTAVLLFLGVGLIAAGSSVFLQTHTDAIQGLIKADSNTGITVANAVTGLGSSFMAPGKPIRLLIPAIGVDAKIQSTGLSWTGNGNMGVPSNFTDVAWYNGGPLPGMPGSAVIDGHLDGKNVPQAVFYNLGSLKLGDIVDVVEDNGHTLQFQVIGTKVYDYNASTTDIFSGGASSTRLNLITCAGDWLPSQKLYNKRAVVFTELVRTY